MKKKKKPSRSGKGTMLEFKKRAENRRAREKNAALPVDTSVLSNDMNHVSNLLAEVFGEEGISMLDAMAGMTLLLVRIAVIGLTDSSTHERADAREEFLNSIAAVYDEVVKQEEGEI